VAGILKKDRDRLSSELAVVKRHNSRDNRDVFISLFVFTGVFFGAVFQSSSYDEAASLAAAYWLSFIGAAVWMFFTIVRDGYQKAKKEVERNVAGVVCNMAQVNKE
jgi:hypothetical protein